MNNIGNLSLLSARGAMEIVVSSGSVDVIRALGCTDDDYSYLIGSAPWKGVDRSRMQRILEGIMYGMLDIIGLPRIEVPAEYAAAVVALFVHPVNYFPACSWIGRFRTVEDVAEYSGASAGLEFVSSAKLFALVLLVVSGEEHRNLVKMFAKKLARQLPSPLDGVRNNERRGAIE